MYALMGVATTAAVGRVTKKHEFKALIKCAVRHCRVRLFCAKAAHALYFSPKQLTAVVLPATCWLDAKTFGYIGWCMPISA